ncbi:hypothetical protein ACH5RR_018255 [Cinchona calisaya]|uniref:DUF4283 domain-containing protein n=1 Tax=Cinchona calisaya TaxID=153742 RepID=A0ABD2ZML1_9GENT
MESTENHRCGIYGVQSSETNKGGGSGEGIQKLDWESFVHESCEYGGLIRTMRTIWKPSNGMQGVVIEENMVVSKFAALVDLQKVIQGSPWSFDKNILLLKEYQRDDPQKSYSMNVSSGYGSTIFP